MRGLRLLVERLRFVEATVEDLSRRQNNMMREGKVVETFPAEGKVRVETDGMRSKKVPWATRAGDIREWSPPKVGERIMLFSPTGEPGHGVVYPGGYSDENPENHDQDSEYKLKVGSATVFVRDGEIELKVGGCRVVINENEIVTYGKTRLNDGNRPIHRIGDVDSDGDKAVTGAAKALA